MISPKYALSHFFHKPSHFGSSAPHVVNLYLDYNCPFLGLIYFKLLNVIKRLDEKAPGSFQFVFVNVVQPWHPNSVLLHEYSLAAAALLREKAPGRSNELFWKVSGSLFKNGEKFYDSATVSDGRNDIYRAISRAVSSDIELPFAEKDVLDLLDIAPTKSTEKASNGGNGATVDVKYFTRYLRTVGAHVTPTVSVDGIVNDSVSSGSSEDDLVAVFEGYLK